MHRRTFVRGSLAVSLLAAQSSRWSLAALRAADTPAMGAGGRQIVLRAADIEDLRAGLRGVLLLPDDAGYDRARRIWNGAFDRRPALIARCAGAADVRRAVDFARSHGLLLAVRGGGHSLSGQSVCDGGLMIDLSGMQSIRVDPVARTVRAEPGVLLGGLDRETQAFGLVTPAGTVSHTGIAGLTLGGGFGRLSRKLGLACDNLLAADVVTADGRLVRAGASEDPDLLWGLRGGGGNFGIVTSFEYRLHPLGRPVLGGPIVYPLEQARAVLRAHADFSLEPPDDIYVDTILTSTPEGNRVLVLDTCYAGAPDAGSAALEPLRRMGKPLQDGTAVLPYVKLQSSGDGAFVPHRNYYVKGGFVRRIEPGLIDEVVGRFEAASLPGASVVFAHIGGAAGRVAPDATAFWQRDARSNMVLFAAWDGEAPAEAHTRWVRATFAATEPFTRGFYVNDVAADDPAARVRANYGGNFARLVALKKRLDPGNLFRLNANIPPQA